MSDEYNEDVVEVTRAVRIMWEIQRGVKKQSPAEKRRPAIDRLHIVITELVWPGSLERHGT